MAATATPTAASDAVLAGLVVAGPVVAGPVVAGTVVSAAAAGSPPLRRALGSALFCVPDLLSVALRPPRGVATTSSLSSSPRTLTVRIITWHCRTPAGP